LTAIIAGLKLQPMVKQCKGMRMPVTWRQSLQHSSGGKKEFVSQENMT
jgi:hypothetical protein